MYQKLKIIMNINFCTNIVIFTDDSISVISVPMILKIWILLEHSVLYIYRYLPLLVFYKILGKLRTKQRGTQQPCVNWFIHTYMVDYTETAET